MFKHLDLTYFARYRDIARLVLKYGGRELLEMTGLDKALRPGDEDQEQAEAAKLAGDLESLGPTFVKLGQVLASRADLLPQSYLEALSRLHDHVEPFAVETVYQIIEDELGKPAHEAFGRFDDQPLAAASIAQVHRGALHDGREVVIKVQRPDAEQIVKQDLRALQQVAWLLDETSKLGKKYNFRELMRQFEQTLRSELNFNLELENTLLIAENLKQFNRLISPTPIKSHSTRKVLTLTHIDGRQVTELQRRRQGSRRQTHQPQTNHQAKGASTDDSDGQRAGESEAKSSFASKSEPESSHDLPADSTRGSTDPLEKAIDGEALADELLHAYLKQIVEDGVFHADPHPGNVLLTHDGKLGLIDFGSLGHVSAGMQEDILHLLVAVSDGRTEEAASAGENLGDRTDDFAGRDYRRGIREAIHLHHRGSMSQMELGHLVMGVCRVASTTGLRIAPEIMLLGKTLMNLDQVGSALAPSFDTNLAIRKHISGFLRRKIISSLNLGQIMTNVIDTRNFLANLPTRLGKTLDTVADNDFRIRVDAIDENRLIKVIEKIANRVTLGLVVMGLLLGGSFIISGGRPEDPNTVFGYDGLGLVMLIIGLVLGGVILFRVLWNDIVRGT